MQVTQLNFNKKKCTYIKLPLSFIQKLIFIELCYLIEKFINKKINFTVAFKCRIPNVLCTRNNVLSKHL